MRGNRELLDSKFFSGRTYHEAPRAELNLVKRIRWARRMKEKFGTDYIHLGRCRAVHRSFWNCPVLSGYWRKTGNSGRNRSHHPAGNRECAGADKRGKRKTGKLPLRADEQKHSGSTFRIKLYAQEFGIHLTDVCLVLTPDMERDMDLTPELLEQLMSRVSDAIELYSPGTQVHLNLSRPEMQEIFQKADAVLDTSDVTLEGMGAPLVSGKLETTGVSFDSFERNSNRMLAHLETAGEKKELILGRMPFDTEYYPLLDNQEGRAAKEMWKRMWTNRKDKRGQ